MLEWMEELYFKNAIFWEQLTDIYYIHKVYDDKEGLFYISFGGRLKTFKNSRLVSKVWAD